MFHRFHVIARRPSPATVLALIALAVATGGVAFAAGNASPPFTGLDQVFATSGPNSNSPKEVTVSCPAGKRVIGTGYDIAGATNGTSPDVLTDVVVDQLQPSDETQVPGFVAASAVEEDPTSANWTFTVYAHCAKASP